MLQKSIIYARSFFSFAGARIYVALALVLTAAMLEGIGILFIVPFLELSSAHTKGAKNRA